MSELKPCLWCDNKPKLVQSAVPKALFPYYVLCPICKRRTDNFETKEEAIDVWNYAWEKLSWLKKI